MPTLYSNIDTGAPSYTFGSTQALQVAAFKAVLKGCLVNGYQGKPAAGWTLVAEDTNYLILRNASQSGYICFNFATADAVKIYLSSTYTGVSGDVITGAGVKTGVAASNATPNWISIASISRYTQFSWSMVADGKSALLVWYWSIGQSGTDYVNMTSLSSPGFTLAFGEDSSGNFIALGGVNNASGASATNHLYAGGMTVLRDPATGLLVDTGSIAPITPLLSLTSNGGATVYPLERVDLIRVPWMTASKDAGFIRGMAYQPTAMGYLNYAIRSVGRAVAVADFNLSNAANPFNLATGLKVFPLKDYYTHGGLFGTDDARFW